MAEEASVLQRHRRAVEGFDRALEHATRTPGAWTKSSPCEGWTAADVVVHVAGVHHRIATQLGADVDPPGSTDADELVNGWHRVRDATVHALAAPGALDTDVTMGVGSMKAGQFMNILMTDTLVHTWDLARAVGADERLDPELVTRAYEAALPLDEMIHSGTAFAPKVPIPEDADAQSKMIAFFGRDPR